MPALRVFIAVIGWPLLVLGWWLGQGCIDDPCEISRMAEVRGLIVLALLGSVVLAKVSARYRLVRAAIWVATGIPAALSRWNDAPTPEGWPIVSEAPGIAAVGVVLITSYVPVLLLALALEWWFVGSSDLSGV